MVLDTSAIIAILFDEDERDAFVDLIAVTQQILISAATAYETAVVAATKKRDPEAVALVDDFLRDLSVTVEPFDVAAALAARDAYLRYGKGFHPASLNLGDCFAYALAKSRDDSLLFKGNDFIKTDILPAWHP